MLKKSSCPGLSRLRGRSPFGAAKARIARDAVSRFAARPVLEIAEIGKVPP